MNTQRMIPKKGITLIEIAMVLAIGAVLIAGVMIFYSGASTNSKTNSAISQIVNTQAVVNQLFSASQNYGTGSMNAAIYSALPAAMQGSTATDIVNAFTGDVTVTGASSTYSITFSDVPEEACSKLASVSLGTELVSVAVDSPTTLVYNRGATAPLNSTGNIPIAAAAPCEGDTNSIIWTFR